MSTGDPPNSNERLAARIYQRAHLFGSFVLRSGATSDEYFDKYLFEGDPELLRDIAESLMPLLPDGAEALAGLELGGVPLATVMSQRTGLPTLFVRKQAKPYGTRKLAEGGDVAARRLVVVEDVITSGGQVLESCRQLRALGADILGVLCVIDREAGGAANLAAEGLELYSLFTMSSLTAAAAPAGSKPPRPDGRD
ncbi:MAG: orotate phosphoribosyltransferase [Actinomycetota bacterium]|nr:orotate phosphoribosyltransferase [Actinomycetota bacterium]